MQSIGENGILESGVGFVGAGKASTPAAIERSYAKTSCKPMVLFALYAARQRKASSCSTISTAMASNIEKPAGGAVSMWTFAVKDSRRISTESFVSPATQETGTSVFTARRGGKESREDE